MNGTKEQLIRELKSLRQRVAEMEISESRHQKAEEELQQAEELFQGVFSSYLDAILVLRLANPPVITNCNPAASKIFGYSSDEMIGQTMLFLHANEAELQAFRKIAYPAIEEKGFAYLPEFCMRRKDGTLCSTEHSVVALKDKRGKHIGFVSVIRDISQRKQLEEKYRTIIHTTTDGFCFGDTRGHFLDVNDAYCDLLGYSRDELLSMNAADIEANETPQEIKRRLRRIKGVGHDRFESRYRRKDGHIIDVDVSITYLDVENGRLFVFLRDITEHKRLERKLKDTELRYRTVFEQSPDGIILVDPKTTKIVEFNDSICRQLGYSRDELLGKQILQFEAKENREGTWSHIAEVSRVGKVEFATKHQTKQGKIKDIVVICKQIKIAGKKFYLSIHRDVTGSKRAEESMRLGSELLDSATDSIFVHDLEGNFLYVNETACRFHGYSKAEFMKMTLQQIVAPERVSSLSSDFSTMLDKGQAIFESAHILKNGSILPVEVHGRVFEYEGNRIFLAVIRDIAERKQREEERKEIEQKAQLASRLASVGEMAAGIAHEINNPLTGVIGYAQLLVQQDIPENIKRDLNAIYESAQRVADIIKRLLTFARQTKPERSYADINELLNNTLAIVGYRLRNDNIQVTTNLDPDLPITIADTGQLQQVLLNLLMNAEIEMKLAHGKGKLLVKTERAQDTIRITVKDDGPGIAKENLERIFDPFFTTREVGWGTGLGLSVCHGIVAEHGGRIYAESKLGKGASLIVELPIIAEYEQVQADRPVVEKARKVAKAKILVVDDEAVVRNFLSRVLTEEGYQVEVVGNGQDALDMMKNRRYRLILLDIKMPDMSGIDLFKQLNEIAESLAKRVVFVTGDIMGEDTKRFLTQTRAPYITKPFDAKQLKAEIKRRLT